MQFAEKGNSWKNLSGAIVCKSSNVYISRLIRKVRLYNPKYLKNWKKEEEAVTSPYTTPLVTQTKNIRKASVIKSPIKP